MIVDWESKSFESRFPVEEKGRKAATKRVLHRCLLMVERIFLIARLSSAIALQYAPSLAAESELAGWLAGHCLQGSAKCTKSNLNSCNSFSFSGWSKPHKPLENWLALTYNSLPDTAWHCLNMIWWIGAMCESTTDKVWLCRFRIHWRWTVVNRRQTHTHIRTKQPTTKRAKKHNK